MLLFVIKYCWILVPRVLVLTQSYTFLMRHDFYQLCSIAYSCIVNQQIIFTASELKGHTRKYSNRESGCGLLTACPVGKLRCNLVAVVACYIHPVVQEFLSAVDITRQDISIQNTICNKCFGQSHMAQVWRISMLCNWGLICMQLQQWVIMSF